MILSKPKPIEGDNKKRRKSPFIHFELYICLLADFPVFMFAIKVKTLESVFLTLNSDKTRGIKG